ncbi:LysR family transcriptional regulator [uncultured Clostridium sp.]|uniref:LysR family transcriptional regulator n=1 Tax=uncultured Clostridium sp. TaxID=59620 RepID=UPI0026395B98|nr:LysR family transcriptional regulator [uncultured Clostridium sp.]
MELLQLKYFMKVAQVQHMTKAANELYISQSSLSRTISRLEEDLGTELFKRDGRRIKLNECGEAFLKRVENAFYEIEQGKREIDKLKGIEKKTIVVGATITRLLPDVFQEFLRERPNIRFKLFQLSTKEIEKELEEGKIDFAISTPLIEKDGVISKELKKEKFFLATSKKHPLAKRKRINIEELETEIFIALSTEYTFQKNIEEMCIANGFTPNIMFESNDIEVLFKLVLDDFGIAIMPEYWWDEERKNLPMKIEIENIYSNRVIGVSWNERKELSEELVDFKEFLVQYFK